MQTMAVQIQDDYVNDFMNYVNNHSDRITIKKDKNLEQDPYFYERQKELYQIKANIDNDKVQMIENDEFWDDIDSFVETLQK
jgi:superfamily II RNA helicase